MKHRKFIFFMAVLLGIILACNALSPTPEPPGVGSKAERGYALSAPILAALEQYKAENGLYPETLAELVPDYLSAVPTRDAVTTLDFSYRSTGDSFAFSFHYIGPGMNTCTYTPEEQWQCSGAF